MPPEKDGPRRWVWVLGGCLVSAPVGLTIVAFAIAIPNFLTFSCKSKRSEAKVHLAGIWAAEQSFRAEYGYYTSDLKALGWSPDGTPNYLYGFSRQGPNGLPPESLRGPVDYDPSRMDTSDPARIGGRHQTHKMKDLDGTMLTAMDLPTGTLVEADHFIAGAVGDIDTDRPLRFDVLVIDETKTLRVIEDDCSN